MDLKHGPAVFPSRIQICFIAVGMIAYSMPMTCEFLVTVQLKKIARSTRWGSRRLRDEGKRGYAQKRSRGEEKKGGGGAEAQRGRGEVAGGGREAATGRGGKKAERGGRSTKKRGS